MKVFVQFLLLSVLVGFYTVTAFADDLTPAAEDVCADLQLPGVTPGLFGLCNAYCEAKDCDAYGALEDQPNSCQKLYWNFVDKALGPDDPLEPLCLEDEPPPEPDPVLCPCWATDETAPDGTPDALQPENLPLGEGASAFCFLEPEVDFYGVGFSDDSSLMVTFVLSGSTCDFGINGEPNVVFSGLEPDEVTSCLVDILVLQEDYATGFLAPCPQVPQEDED